MKRTLKFPLKFEEGIRNITRKRTTKQALKAFEKFYLSKLLHFQMVRFGNTDEAIAREELRDIIEALREKGFEQDDCEWLKRGYQERPRHRPRKKVKIKFDANGIPKVTKTPLEPQLSARFAYLRRTSGD
jgi:hypothetical protein